MCEHKRTEIKELNDNGYAQRICLDCGEDLGQIPATYAALDDIYTLHMRVPKGQPKDDSFYYAKPATENAYASLKRRH